MGPFVLAAAIPLLFLHRNYQPGLDVGSLHVDLADVAVLAVVVVAIAERPRIRIRDWVALLAFAALVLVGVAWGSHFSGYPVGTHLTTAAKWIEYMLLAPAVVSIAKRERDLVPAAVALVLWDVAAGVVALMQFFGVLGDLDHTPAGRRKPSFVGVHDYAALSGAALVIALVILVRGSRTEQERRVALAAGFAGVVGMVIGGAFDSLVGLALASAGLIVSANVRDARRLGVIAAVFAATMVGIVAIRSSAVADGLKFLGIKQGTGGASIQIQSSRPRALLAYIGGREFVGHPLLGVGWQGSSDPYAFEPYLADAHRRFVQPPDAVPSRRNRWGVQNAYVQSLADLGVLGLPAFLAALLVPIGRAWRAAAGDARIAGLALVLLALGAWNGYGLVAGIPLAALTWLAVGVAVAAASFPREAS
ncbi:MAG: O-antigen ligase family protein [Gaiellaceae bacterium]